jgi:hypothetical protein
VGGLRRLHSEELCNYFISQNISGVTESRRVRWMQHVACMGNMRNSYNILVGKLEVKRPLRRHRHRWEDNI